MRVGWNTWSLAPSEEWEITDGPDCMSLTLNVDSALQVSSAIKQTGIVTEQDLLYPEGERSSWGKAKRTTCGDFRGIMYEYEQDGVAWKRWFVSHEAVLVYITYVGTPDGARREENAVIELLKTLSANGARDA